MTQQLSFGTERRGISPVVAGLAGLVYPVTLIVLALGVGFRRDGDYADFAASFVAALLILVAEPTAWAFSFDFIDAGRFTIIFVGGLTSLPLWFLLGRGLAGGQAGWSSWIRRYVAVCLGWTALNVLVLGVVSSILD